MIGYVLWAVTVALGLLLAREWLDRRACRVRHQEAFDGKIYPVGLAWVAERRPSEPRVTVICMHGFLENLHYFTEYYAAPDIQLILINSADYHLPVPDPRIERADWAVPPNSPPGTITYDAEVLLQALEHLPVTRRIRVHGHSRGGAVILEAASRRPDLFRNAELVLEAPTLPGARSSLPVSALMLWLLPFVAPLWRWFPITPLHSRLYGPLDNPRKRRLIDAYPSNPRRTRTIRRNLQDLQQWMSGQGPELYTHVRQGAVLIATGDHVLDVDSMRASAQQAGGRLAVHEIPDCSHFVVPDQPEQIPQLSPTPGNDNERTEEQT